jgi:hypothetical protein
MKNVILLFFLAGCGTTPPEARNSIHTEGFAGHYSHYKYTFGDKSKTPVEDGYLYIGCDGNIKYKIDEPWALFFKEDTDDGNIKTIKDGEVIYQNWLGLTHSEFIRKPAAEANGCRTIKFKNSSFSTYYPIDCSQPRKTFGEHLTEAYDHLKKNDYVFCD